MHILHLTYIHLNVHIREHILHIHSTFSMYFFPCALLINIFNAFTVYCYMIAWLNRINNHSVYFYLFYLISRCALFSLRYFAVIAGSIARPSKGVERGGGGRVQRRVNKYVCIDTIRDWRLKTGSEIIRGGLEKN